MDKEKRERIECKGELDFRACSFVVAKFRQMPHCHLLLDIGGSVQSSSKFRDPCLLPPGLGNDGSGQTEPMSSAEQNGHI